MNSNFIMYFCLLLLIIYLFISAYIRVKMQFWYSQPVFHIYNIKYWIKPPGFISLSPPPINKFVNLRNNKLINFNDATDIDIKRICNFIQSYYIIDKNATYIPSIEDITSYLGSNNHPSFFNIYQEPTLLFENGNTTPIVDQELISVVSSRVLNVSLFYKNKSKNITFPAYYVDHLCVKPGYRKKGISPQVIQTFYYNVARTNNKVNAYMFKREGQQTAIVPLVYYETYCYDMTMYNELSIETVLNASMTIIEITSNQLQLLYTFIKQQLPKFECVILPDLSNLLNLIKNEKLLIYTILFNGEIIAAYIFRPLELYYGNQKAIECISIISNCKISDVLVTGFNMCLLKIKNKTKSSILFIESNADSLPVINALNTNTSVLYKYKIPTAFYLYNYASYTVKNNKTLLIY